MTLYAIVLLYLIGSSAAATVHGNAMQNLERLLNLKGHSSSQQPVRDFLGKADSSQGYKPSVRTEDDSGEWIATSYCSQEDLCLDNQHNNALTSLVLLL
jgi:hypothetical protein